MAQWYNNMKELSEKIISKLPYGDGFLFVDEITYVDDNKIVGNYTFRSDAPFYKWHFKQRPVTPGVLLIECAGQIAMSSHIVYLEKIYDLPTFGIPVLQYFEASFLKEVFPNDKIEIESEKMYYRNGVLKSKVLLKNSQNEVCLTGTGLVKLVKQWIK